MCLDAALYDSYIPLFSNKFSCTVSRKATPFFCLTVPWDQCGEIEGKYLFFQASSSAMSSAGRAFTAQSLH